MENNKVKRTRISVIIVAGITFIVLLVTFAAVLIGYWEFTSVLEQQYNDAAYEVAYTARSILNADKLSHYVETLETDEEFDIIQKRLDELTDSMDVNFIYVGQVDPEGKSIIYIYDSVNSALGYDRYPLGKVGEDFDPQYNQILKDVITTGEKSNIYLYSYTEWGDHTTALLPVKDSSGKVVSIICVEKTMSVLQDARNEYVFHVMMSSAIVLVIAVLISFLLLRMYIISPIEEVTLEAERFANDHTEGNELKALSSNNEIGLLAHSIRKMESDILQYIDNITNITAEKERIGAELGVATKIQDAMLPNTFPPYPERNEFDIFGSMHAAKEVGGDFYDFFFVDPDHFALVIADVSGKGVPAAMFMMLAKTMIQNRALVGGTPSEVLEFVNNQIVAKNDASMFVTVWFAILTVSTGDVIATNAGHEYPAIRKANGKYEYLKDKHGIPVGVIEERKYEDYTFKLEPGDSIFVYTDGVTEATNTEAEFWGMDNLLDALNRQDYETPKDTALGVTKILDEFVGEAAQFDDITQLCLLYNGDNK